LQMRVFSAVTVAFAVCAASPAFADAQSHVQAAKKAEKKGDWKKALEEWKAAYNSDINAEYLIGIGDAYAHLGNKGEAKKNYEAYLADPLALPANAEKVKTKIAQLDSPPGGALALPGAALALPGAESAPPSLDLAAAPSTDSKNKKKKGKDAAPPPPALDLPGAMASNDPKAADSGMLALPGLDAAPTAPKSGKKIAAGAATARAAGASATD